MHFFKKQKGAAILSFAWLVSSLGCAAGAAPGEVEQSAVRVAENSETPTSLVHRLFLQWVLESEIIPRLQGVDVLIPDHKREPFLEGECQISLLDLAVLGKNWVQDPSLSVNVLKRQYLLRFSTSWRTAESRPSYWKFGRDTVRQYFVGPLFIQSSIIHELKHFWDHSCVSQGDGRLAFKFARESRAYEVSALYLKNAKHNLGELSDASLRLIEAYDQRTSLYLYADLAEQRPWYKYIAGEFAQFQNLGAFDIPVSLVIDELLHHSNGTSKLPLTETVSVARKLTQIGGRSLQEYVELRSTALEDIDISDAMYHMALLRGFKSAVDLLFENSSVAWTPRNWAAEKHAKMRREFPSLYALNGLNENIRLVLLLDPFDFYSDVLGIRSSPRPPNFRENSRYRNFSKWLQDKGHARSLLEYLD